MPPDGPTGGGALGGGFAPTLLLVWRTRGGLPQSCSGLARLTRQGGFAHILVAVMEGIAFAATADSRKAHALHSTARSGHQLDA